MAIQGDGTIYTGFPHLPKITLTLLEFGENVSTFHPPSQVGQAHI